MAGSRPYSLPQPLDSMFSLIAVDGLLDTETLTGNLTLDATYPMITKLDPGGSARDVTLEASASSTGLVRFIVNAADAAENLVVKDDGAATIATLAQNRAGLFHCNGTAWSLVCIFTIALS